MNELATYIRQLRKEDPLFQREGSDDSIGKRIAFNVKRIRKLKGLTQLELAEAMGVKQPFIARIESGKNNISVKKLEQIAEVFKIDPVLILRPIYEEGTPREIAKLVVDTQFIVHAANIGAEIHYKEVADALIGKPLRKDCPIRQCVAKAFETNQDVINYPYVSREKGILEKKSISVTLLRGATKEILGAEVEARSEY